MKLPILNTCDLVFKNNKHCNLVVHNLEKLLDLVGSIPSKPHQHKFYQLLFVEEGSGEHIIDFKSYEIKPKSLFLLAPGQVHHLMISSDAKGVLVNFEESLFHTLLSKPSFVGEYPFFNLNGKYSYYQLCNKKHPLILDSLSRIVAQNHNDLIQLYLLELFFLVNQLHQKSITSDEVKEANRLIIAFEAIIEQNYHKERYPKFYAKELSVTPNYLNAVCKKYKGITAGEMIRERIILEIKRLLINSDLSVSEIGYLLGFDDNSYFSKFFKQSEQVSPSKFRAVVFKKR